MSSVLLDGGARGAPLLQLGRRDETGRVADRCVPVPRLPPVVVVLADHLQDVADAETDARLHARDQLVVAWLVLEQRSHEDLHSTHSHIQGRTKTKLGLMLRCRQGRRPIIVTIRD